MEGSDDPLESGLELMASPPGKKLQQLNLLSGGEKAITALALIFSVFLTKPSPICILDEVDAPLDDSNVDRFCDLLDEIINKCITMNEPGVSQLVSVSLKEAEFIKAAEYTLPSKIKAVAVFYFHLLNNKYNIKFIYEK